MATIRAVLTLVTLFLIGCHGGELLQNGNLESMTGWHCYNMNCELSTDHHCGSHSLKSTQRHHTSDGPLTSFSVTKNYMYNAEVYVKLLNDAHGKLGQELEILIDYQYTDGHHWYKPVAQHPLARSADGWIHLQGAFRAPNSEFREVRMKIQGPDPSVDFLVDCASITNIWYGSGGWRSPTDQVIHDVRQSNINIHVTTHGNVNRDDVQIQVLQTKKSFPIGTVVNAWHYEDDSMQRYRDFIHDHFNWAVHESSLKWPHVEPTQGHYHFDLPLRVLSALKSHGLKVRGHNLIWSIESSVQDWVKHLSGNSLRAAVEHHINQTMGKTRGQLEHWDVNNEDLHGQWYQERLQDASYEQDPFRIAHNFDPTVKLFLNDYGVVSHGASTGAYIAKAQRLLRAKVGLSGLGAQCHFYTEEEPNPYLIKRRLDELSKTGLPVWITEFNVVAADENKRADFVETAMRAFYGHPAVEGILLWGFWDKSHSRGPHAALTTGDNMQLTAAGRRFLDLWENQWMTDETHVLSQAGSSFTVRGFHGDYTLHVRYQGRELNNLKQTFTLGKSAHTVNVDVHV